MGSQFCAYLRTVPLSTYKHQHAHYPRNPHRDPLIFDCTTCVYILHYLPTHTLQNVLYTPRVLGHVLACLLTTPLDIVRVCTLARLLYTFSSP